MINEIEKTLIDMHDILLRIKALESHTETNFNKHTLYYIVRARKLTERAIKNAEVHLHNDIVYSGRTKSPMRFPSTNPY